MIARLHQMKLRARLRLAKLVVRNDFQALLSQHKPRIRYLDPVWCNPMDIRLSTRYFIPKKGGYLHSGRELDKNELGKKQHQFIVSGGWDQHTTPIEDVKHITRTIDHFDKGLDWDTVGEVTWMMDNIAEYGVQDDCRNLEDVTVRCDAIDRLKQSIQQGGRFYSRRELNPDNFREKGGIGICLSRNGDIIWFSDGAHRLAIAQMLCLKEVPVCVYMIHPDAISNGTWKEKIYFERRYH